MAGRLNEIIENLITKPLAKAVTEEIIAKADKKEPWRWEVPLTWNQTTDKRKKNEVNVDYAVLRSFSVNYPVARACIDYLTNRITELDWSVEDGDGDSDTREGEISAVTEFLSFPYGKGRRHRLKDLTKEIIEDLLVLDATAIYLEKTRGGDLLSLVPIDASTIKLRVDELGRTPAPPEVAYEQYIRGEKVAQMTTEDLYYSVRKRRTNSPYGLSPLESLIIQIEAALRGEKFNVDYFKEGNDPEGLYTITDTYTPDQLKELQDNFDAMLAGESAARRRIKFMPPGTYSPTRRPEDMAFERFEKWLMQQTCAVFGVPPEEIGFTQDVNRATAESQSNVALIRGVKPIANFIADVYTDIIETELDVNGLKFQWLDMDPSDQEREAKIDQMYIESGVFSVDEVRQRLGLEPIGLDHYLMTRFGPQLVSEILNPPTQQQMENDDTATEIRRWRKCAMNDVSSDKDFRKFESELIPDDLRTEIEIGLQYAKSKQDVHKLFEPFLSREIHAVRKVLALTRELDEISYGLQNSTK